MKPVKSLPQFIEMLPTQPINYFTTEKQSVFSKNWGHEYSRFGKEQIDSTNAICSFLNLLYSPRNIEMLRSKDHKENLKTLYVLRVFVVNLDKD